MTAIHGKSASAIDPAGKDSLALASSAREILKLALFSGLAAGFLEAISFQILRLNPTWLTWARLQMNVSSEFFWVAPLVNAILFVLLGFALALVVSLLKTYRRLSPLLTGPVIVFIFGLLAFFPFLDVFDHISSKACLVLAAGMAFQGASYYRRNQPHSRRIIEVGILILGILTIGSFLATRGRTQFQRLSERRNAVPAPTQAPNVLVIVIDTLRADHLSAYGYGRETTPHIDQLAAQGILFEHAYAPSSWTPPSHASLMTGEPVFTHRVDGKFPVLSDNFLTLAEWMSGQGYETAGFSGNTIWINRNTGFAQGFDTFGDYFSSVEDMLARTTYGREVAVPLLSKLGWKNILGRKTAEDINEAFFKWMDVPRDRPFFAFLNYFDVHDPYISPQPYMSAYMDRAQQEQSEDYTFSPHARAARDEIPLLIDGYDGALQYTDLQTGKLLSHLEERGLLDNTLIILTSDHGEAFGEHGLFNHGHSLYTELLHVPLIVRLPHARNAGLRIQRAVSLQNIPATIAGLLGSKSPFPGEALLVSSSPGNLRSTTDNLPVRSELLGRGWLPDYLPVSRGWIQSLIYDRWHLIQSESGEVELYDLQADPLEQVNLAGTPPGEEVIRRLLPYFSDRP